MRMMVKVFGVLVLVTLVAHGGYHLGRFREAVVLAWREALSVSEPRRAYECSREAWFASERLEVPRHEPDFAEAIARFYEAAIDVYADGEDTQESQRLAEIELVNLQQRFRSIHVPSGVRWYLRSNWEVPATAGLLLVGCVVRLATLPKHYRTWGRRSR